MHLPGRGRTRCGVLALWSLSAAILGTPAFAQASGGSSSGVSLAHGTLGGAGSAGSTGFALNSGLAQPATGSVSSSPSYQMRTGVTWVPPQVTTDHPIVFGLVGGAGEAAGGELVSAFGFNFTAPGAGANTLAVGGIDAAGTVTVSNTEIRALTPVGVDGNANPLAFTGASVTNSLGSDDAPDAFVYRPALTQVDFGRIGGSIDLRLYALPGSFALVMYGQSIPGTTIPVPPYGGSLEVLVGLLFVTPLLPVPTGQLELTQKLANKPALIGFVLELQALSFDDGTFATGSFSNLLTITVQP